MNKKPTIKDLESLLSNIDRARVQGAFFLIHIEEYRAIKEIIKTEIQRRQKKKCTKKS